MRSLRMHSRSILMLSVFIALAMGCAKEEAMTPAPSEPTAAATSAPAAAPAASRDVCAMLSAEELQSVAGIEGSTGSPSTSGGADVCSWVGSTGRSVIVQVFPSASSYESARDRVQGFYEATAEEVAGVGDKAFFIPGKTGFMDTATLVTQKGQTPVSVQVMGMDVDMATMKNEASAVAQAVLGKL